MSTAKVKPISATGIKGFLTWLKGYNGTIYAQVAAQLPAKMPQLFSQFEAAGGLKGLACRRSSSMGRLGKLGTGFTGLTGMTNFSAAGATNFGVTNFTGSTDWGDFTGLTGITGSTFFESGLTGSTGVLMNTGQTAFSPTGMTNFGTGSTSAAVGTGAGAATVGAAALRGATPAIDVSDAANPGPISSADANSVGQLVNDVASATQTVAGAVTTAAIVQNQLQRAQSGLTPLPIYNGATGPLLYPTSGTSVFADWTGTDWLLAAGALVGGVMLLSGSSRKRAA